MRVCSTGFDSKPHGLAVGDFNNDGRLDIAVTNNGNANIGFFFCLGDGIFSKQSTVSLINGTFPVAVEVGDFDNDNLLDIVVSKYYDNDISVLLGYGNGSFADQMTFSTGLTPYCVAIGDFNNDNQTDIVTANWGSNDVSVLLGYGDGTFADEMRYPTGSSPYSVTVGDFNNDTILDIVVANHGNDNVGIFLGWGNGSFSSQETFTTGFESEPNAVTVGDFNNDTLLDIIVVNYGTSNVGVLLGYGNGSFANVKIFSIGYGSLPFALAVGDLNNDGKLDFAVANEGTDNVQIFLQTC